MRTAALAIIDLDIKKWNDIAFGSGKVNAVCRPRELMKMAS